MTAPHFFAEDVSGDVVELTGDEARHAVRVARLGAGERITISDGAGTVVAARIERTASVLVARVESRARVEPPLPLIVVWQAIPKAGKLDDVVRRLTEVGVWAVVPFPARRSIARWDDRKAQSRVSHLRAIAREAAKTARRAWLPRVEDPRPLADASGPGVALHESATKRLRDTLAGDPPPQMVLVVGPEGGLDEEEVAGLESRGVAAATLGPSILRTESAATIAATIVAARYGALG